MYVPDPRPHGRRAVPPPPTFNVDWQDAQRARVPASEINEHFCSGGPSWPPNIACVGAGVRTGAQCLRERECTFFSLGTERDAHLLVFYKSAEEILGPCRRTPAVPAASPRDRPESA